MDPLPPSLVEGLPRFLNFWAHPPPQPPAAAAPVAVASQPRTAAAAAPAAAAAAAAPSAPLPQPRAVPIILRDVVASSTDNPSEHMRNTLARRLVPGAMSVPYWSSRGSGPEGSESLVYALKAPVCLVRALDMGEHRGAPRESLDAADAARVCARGWRGQRRSRPRSRTTTPSTHQWPCS